jgi:mannosyl-oligosaccharide alpha-1,2-mannosidase
MRFRRYRVFLAAAILMIVLIVRLRRPNESGWDSISPGSIDGLGAENNPKQDNPAAAGPPKPPVDLESIANTNEPQQPAPKPIVEDGQLTNPKDVPVVTANPKEGAATESKEDTSITPEEGLSSEAKDGITSQTKPAITPEQEDSASDPKDKPSEHPTEDATATPKDVPVDADYKPTEKTETTKTVPQVTIPDRKPLTPAEQKIEGDSANNLHQVPAGRVDPIVLPPTTPIHWKKQEEHFPIPVEELIHLPIGKPRDIPKIQFKFPDETPTAKAERELRLGVIKAEFEKAWKGYKTHAWMHDELMPETGGFKDPFCGWAATLVDSLDTLWIMGLEDDFVEAVEAVRQIDFTTCARSDLQVFEITIRYLGGLVAAFDISGQIYSILLDKAVELAEILMGAFDTPNRMPVLFYQWKPAFASQAHRAGSRANLAELGSLTVEFTRLAQLTKEPKYYDAVARITDALEDWQKRGTRMKGVFPDDVDASGCNRTVIEPAEPAIAPVIELPKDSVGYQAPMPDAVKEPRPRKQFDNGQDDIELQVIPGQNPGDPAKGAIINVEKGDITAKVSKRDSTDAQAAPVAEGHTPPPEDLPPVAPVTPIILDSPEPPAAFNSTQPSKTVPPTPIAKEHALADWDCIPQGLTSPNSARDTFSMGGGQDSTYEYFSKVS